METKQENNKFIEEKEMLENIQKFATENNIYIKDYKIISLNHEWQIVFSNKTRD